LRNLLTASFDAILDTGRYFVIVESSSAIQAQRFHATEGREREARS